jgi:hypothetical protein
VTWQITGKQKFPAVIGEPFGGGFFAGYISHTADGNPTHALIVAPRATGATGTGYTLTTNLQWKIANTTTAGTTSAFDGAANTAAMVTAGIADHPAAQFCVGLSIGGFTDWYLPSRYEFEIAYFNLKPNTDLNSTAYGQNPYSVPRRDVNYLALFPAQTYLASFAVGGQQAFSVAGADHWTSTEADNANGLFLRSLTGVLTTTLKTGARTVRAFRRIAL